MAYDPRLDPNNSEYDPDFVATDDTVPGQQPLNLRGLADAQPDAVWQDYAHTAIRSLYPHLTDGVDYVWGRKDADSPPEMVYWNEDKFPAPDLGRVEEVATLLLERDPYRAGGYEPKPSLHGGSVLAPGDVPKYGRAEDHPDVRPVPADLSVGEPYNPPRV